MAYRIATIPMTLSYVQGHSPVISLCNWSSSYSRATCAAVDRISSDIAPRAVSLRQISFLLEEIRSLFFAHHSIYQLVPETGLSRFSAFSSRHLHCNSFLRVRHVNVLACLMYKLKYFF